MTVAPGAGQAVRSDPAHGGLRSLLAARRGRRPARGRLCHQSQRLDTVRTLLVIALKIGSPVLQIEL
ncbi:hypothetical protein PCANC_07085 [Puccinia coronata f. sp. avenae]|uniref:Uncharacterized protein n=1 Tax=Puccinia coronata f. sp. avenae TaxID=200324 RepID=A0A2N5VZL5_9BASI|nr:hypothetical protein PCANC_24793 [Puccinia coronata f. sp. avenae]PLW55443.1 hypothetical protein PCANC_07085 [Puccinia coronata f. sp. avenae]